MPCSPYGGDNHVVTHVYIRELNKWVMLDPTLNAFVSNEAGDYLSLIELRDCLANQQLVFYNDGANYNGEKLSEESIDYWIEYFAKNLFYFKSSEKSTYGDYNVIGEGKSTDNRLILLSPHGYDPKEMNLSNIEYRKKIYGDSPILEQWLDRVIKEPYIYCSTDDFEKTPY